MSDGTESSLAPEVAVTPRNSLREEKSSAEHSESAASAASSFEAIALGSVLELTWLSIAGHHTSLPQGVDQNAPLELSLRWTVQESSRMRQSPPQSKRVSLPAKAFKRDQWELPTGETAIRVELTQGLIQRLVDANNGSFLLLHASLSPRRSSTSAWSLRLSVAVDGKMLKRCRSDHALRVEAGVCDQDGRSAGVAATLLRCGLLSQLEVLPTGTQMHHPQAVNVRLQLARLVRALEGKVGSTPLLDVVLEASISGQEASRAVRSKPWKLLKPPVDLSMETTMALVVNDTQTQAIHLVLYRHSAKERALRLAEALVSIQSLERSGEMAAIPLMDSASIDNRGEDTPTVWAELTAKVVVLPRQVENGLNDLVMSAATSVLGESKYEAELVDVEGTLAIELIEAAFENIPSEDLDTRFAINIQLRVPSSKWSSATSSVPIIGAKRSVSFKNESFSAPVQWATKERVVPTFSCTLTLQLNATDVVNGSSRRAKSTNRESGEKTARGVHCIQLPVLFAFPDQWTAMELPISLTTDGTRSPSPILLRLRLRMQFVTRTSNAATDTVKDRHHGSGHLTLSNVRAGGAFLRAHRPKDTYAIAFETASIKASEGFGSTMVVSAFADEKTVRWDRSASCEITKGEFAPIVILRILRTHDTKDTTEARNSTEENSELLGTLMMPLPGDVLGQKHLVSLSLPFIAVAAGDRDCCSPEGTTRKVGTISFDLQFFDDSPSTASRLTSSTKLVFHRVVWTKTPPALALAMSTTQSLVMQSSFSIIGGDSLNEVLWSHDTKHIQATKDQSGEYVVNDAIRLSDATVAKLLVATANKSMLIVKLTSSDTGRDSEVSVLGQAVIPIRGGWAAFMDQEQCKWHKVYAVGRRETGSPEAIGEIQVSVVLKEESSGDSGHDGTIRSSSVDGWLYFEILEAVWTTSSNISTTVSTEAFVQIVRIGSNRKPQNTKPQWSVDGVWKWNGDGVLMAPHIEGDGEGEDEKYSLTLVVGQEHRLEVATLVDGMSCIERSCAGGAFEDWLTTTDNHAHTRIRVFYLPAVAGSLKVDIHRIQNLLSTRTGNISLQRIALQVSMAPSAATKRTEAKEGDVHTLQSLEGSQLEISFNTGSNAFSSRAIPMLKFQLLGYATGNHELCIGEGFAPITVLNSLFVQPNPPSVTQWVTLHSRHDATNRVAVLLVGFQFLRESHDVKTLTLAQISSLNKWREVCAAVLTLWKKLFYSIDSDHNGRVVLDEFKELFISHTEVFTQTEDGKMLMNVLFPQLDEKADLPAIERLFDEMDVNGDKGIEWIEFVDFMQAKLLRLKPQLAQQVSPVAYAVESDSAVQLRSPEPVSVQRGDVPTRELRKKRREDPHSTISPPPTLDNENKSSSKRLSVRQLSAATALRSNGVAPVNALTPREETTQLQAKLESLEAMLNLEKQKSDRLQDELRSLRHANHQLQIQREREVLEEKTKAQFLEEAIRSHEQALKEREMVRARHHTASIVLQSKVRMRLEQKKFQALKLLRWNAAVRIQCAYRCFVAGKLYRTLLAAEMWRRKRITSATRLQHFTRVHLRRKERLLHREARELSAVLLQKHVRRWLAVTHKEKCLKAAVKIQSWSRGRLAVREAQRLRYSTDRLKHWILGRVHRRRWFRLRANVARVQRWWRRANELWWAYVTQLEAAMCIQAVWRGHHNRKRLREVLMSRRNEARDDTQLPLMTSAMGDEAEDGVKAVNENFLLSTGGEVAEGDEAEDMITGPYKAMERDDDLSDGEQFPACDATGDESALPEDTLLGWSGEGEHELVDPETTSSASRRAENEALCLSTADSESEASLTVEPTSVEGQEVNEDVVDNSTSGDIEAVDEGASPQAEVADVLATLIHRVHLDVSVEASLGQVPLVLVPAEEARQFPSIDSSDARALESTAIEQIEDDVKIIERVEAACGASAENEDEVVRLVVELVECVEQQPVALDDQEPTVSGDGEEVERVLRDLIDRVSGHEDAEDIFTVVQGTEDELIWRDDQAGDENAGLEVLDSVRAEENDAVVGSEESHVDESGDEGATRVETVVAHDGDNILVGDQRLTIEAVDAVEPLVLENHDKNVSVAIGQDVNPTDNSSSCGSIAEASEAHVDARVDDCSEGIALKAVESMSQDDEETHAATEDRQEQGHNGEAVDGEVVPTRIDPESILPSGLSSDQDEQVDVITDESVATVAAEPHVVDPERRADDGRVVMLSEAEAMVAPFDVSDSDEDEAREEESSLDGENSEANDDLQFIADADAVTHVEDASLSEDDALDDQDSRLPSEREDSDQQLLLDFEELSQPAASSTQSGL